MNHILIGFFLFTSSSTTCQSNDQGVDVRPGANSERILIVYLTRTNNTKAIARMINQEIGGKLEELELVTPYPEDYNAIVDQVVKENESGFLPPLKTKIKDIEKYDMIFVGYPTWGMKLPPPMKTFLKEYNLRGKTIVPFNTNAGYGPGNSLETIKQLCPASKILEAFSTQGGIERDGILLVMKDEKETEARKEVTNWLQKLKISK